MPKLFLAHAVRGPSLQSCNLAGCSRVCGWANPRVHWHTCMVAAICFHIKWFIASILVKREKKERERERASKRQRERKRERECVCVCVCPTHSERGHRARFGLKMRPWQGDGSSLGSGYRGSESYRPPAASSWFAQSDRDWQCPLACGGGERPFLCPCGRRERECVCVCTPEHGESSISFQQSAGGQELTCLSCPTKLWQVSGSTA